MSPFPKSALKCVLGIPFPHLSPVYSTALSGSFPVTFKPFKACIYHLNRNHLNSTLFSAPLTTALSLTPNLLEELCTVRHCRFLGTPQSTLIWALFSSLSWGLSQVLQNLHTADFVAPLIFIFPWLLRIRHFITSQLHCCWHSTFPWLLWYPFP